MKNPVSFTIGIHFGIRNSIWYQESKITSLQCSWGTLRISLNILATRETWVRRKLRSRYTE